MKRKYLPAALWATLAAAAFFGVWEMRRNTFVLYQPVSIEQLAAQPDGMTLFYDGKFWIRRKDLPVH